MGGRSVQGGRMSTAAAPPTNFFAGMGSVLRHDKSVMGGRIAKTGLMNTQHAHSVPPLATAALMAAASQQGMCVMGSLTA
jgi:SRSO17 transposase